MKKGIVVPIGLLVFCFLGFCTFIIIGTLHTIYGKWWQASLNWLTVVLFLGAIVFAWKTLILRMQTAKYIKEPQLLKVPPS